MTTIFGFNWFDIAIVLVIVVSTLLSLSRGFMREAFSTLTWILAIWIGFRFSNNLASYFENYIHTPSLRVIAAFAIIFLVTLVIGALFAHLLSSFVNQTGLNGTDRLVGLIFGIARGILLVTVLLLVCTMTMFVNDPWWKQSVLLPHFMPLVEWLRSVLPESFTKLSHAI